MRQEKKTCNLELFFFQLHTYTAYGFTIFFVQIFYFV